MNGGGLDLFRVDGRGSDRLPANRKSLQRGRDRLARGYCPLRGSWGCPSPGWPSILARIDLDGKFPEVPASFPRRFPNKPPRACHVAELATWQLAASVRQHIPGRAEHADLAVQR